MRAPALLAVLLIASAFAAKAAPVSVADIVRDPAAFIDKRITVTGVIGSVDVGYGGTLLCPRTEERAQLPAPTAEHPICVDLRVHDDLRKDIQIKQEKYRRAVVEITGLYWHRCLAERRQQEPEVVREECKDSGLNGYLGVESLAITGCSADRNPTGLYPDDKTSNAEMPELAPQSDERAKIDGLVQTFLTAVRAKDANALAMLYPKEIRGFARIGFTVPSTRLYWLVLSPELAVTSESARRAGSGYHVYGGGRSVDVCFCRRADCTGQWPRSDEDIAYFNLASPTVCYGLERRRGVWWLRD